MAHLRFLRAAGFGLLSSLCVSAYCDPTLLRNATVIDGTGREPQMGQSILIGDDGRIAAVGPARAVGEPRGVKVIDATGKFVLPGFIDGHVHVGVVEDQVQDAKNYTAQSVERDLRTFAAYGVTTVAIYGTDKDLIFDMRRMQRAGRPTMARIYTAGQGLVFRGSYGGVLGLTLPVADAAEAVRYVDRQAAKGVDLIKLWMDDEHQMIPLKMPYEVSAAIIDQAHHHHLKVVAHVYYLADAKKLVEQGLDGLAHQVRDQPVDLALLQAMQQHGTWQAASTLSREAAFSWAVMPFLEDTFFQRGVSQSTLDVLRSPEREQRMVLGASQVAGLPYSKEVFWDNDRVFWQALKNFAAEAKAGVPYGMGTDSGAPGRFPGFNAHEELQLLVMDGLTPMQAIVAATSSNAKFLGATDLGVVAAGKWADLVVLDADPLSDIRNTRKISSVYIAGKTVPTVWGSCQERPRTVCTDPLDGAVSMRH